MHETADVPGVPESKGDGDGDVEMREQQQQADPNPGEGASARLEWNAVQAPRKSEFGTGGPLYDHDARMTLGSDD